jgi:sulfoacetaldehyde dehydrogenase
MGPTRRRGSLKAVIWDERKRLRSGAVITAALAKTAGFTVPEDAKFIWVEGDGIGPSNALPRKTHDTVVLTCTMAL